LRPPPVPWGVPWVGRVWGRGVMGGGLERGGRWGQVVGVPVKQERPVAGRVLTCCL
jgi:hypothetical protein